MTTSPTSQQNARGRLSHPYGTKSTQPQQQQTRPCAVPLIPRYYKRAFRFRLSIERVRAPSTSNDSFQIIQCIQYSPLNLKTRALQPSDTLMINALSAKKQLTG